MAFHTRYSAPSWLAPIALVLLVFALRAPLFGNPHVYLDEEFYLLIGARIHDGAWPYLDIWDRKPLLLFLITAVAAWFGDGVIAFQILAAICTALTTLILYRLARRFTDPLGACAAAALYPVAATLLLGGNGQSPIFYNLLMVSACGIIFHMVENHSRLTARRICWTGMAAMLLTGLAMQIKYSPLLLGIYLGLILQYLVWQRLGSMRTLAISIAWAATALLPTVLAFLAYTLHGAGAAFWFANFESILLRDAEPAGVVMTRLLTMVGILALPSLLGLWSYFRRPALNSRWLPQFVLGWLVVEWVSLLIFGSYFQHYALPLLLPTALMASFAQGLGRYGLYALLGAGLVAGQIKTNKEVQTNGGRAAIDHMVTVMADARNCPFIYDGPVAVYHIGRFCLPTRYAFTAHLSREREHGALGVSSEHEVARIMDSRPDYVMMEFPQEEKVDHATAAIMRERLAREYHRVAQVPQRRGRVVAIYRLNRDLAPLPNAIGPVPAR